MIDMVILYMVINSIEIWRDLRMSVLLNAMERKDNAKKVRRLGYVPGSIHGPGVEKNINIQLDGKEVGQFLKSHSIGAKTKIKINENEFPCVIKTVQYAPLVNKPIHIEFYASSENQTVKVQVSLRFKGKEMLAKSNLVLNILKDEIEIQGVLKDLPESIDVDLSSMKETGEITANDVVLPEGIKLLSRKDEILARVERAATLPPQDEE